MSDKQVKHTSEIKILVGKDENHVPVRMKWSAADAEVKEKETSAMILSLWDPEDKNTLRMDLWVKDLSVEEMKQFFHQTLLTMADTFEKATGETNICEDLRDYCYHFADKMKIMPEE